MVILISFIITILMILWYNSSVVEEYGRIFGIKWLKVDKFDEKYKNDFELTYLSYLRQFHNCFFVRLITCPICLGFWLSLIGCIFCDDIIDFPIIYIISLYAYYIFIKIQK